MSKIGNCKHGGGHAYLRIEGLSKAYEGFSALEDVTLEVAKGEFVVIVGPSGCGKSTALRLIAGLEIPDEGSVRLAGREVTFEEPAKRDIAMVFQDYALYPHMTVFDNLAFPLKNRKRTRREIREAVDRIAEKLEIEDLLSRKPSSLSGGQQQRVAIGRALVRDPALFLMDEPLSNLDAKLRMQMRGELARIHARTESTIVYVTHDQTEALSLANRVVVLNKGRVQQIGTADQLYAEPANTFVAGFIGAPPMNLFDGRCKGGCVSLLGNKANGLPLGLSSVESVIVGVRPDKIQLVKGFSDAECSLRATVDRVEFTGAESLLYAQTASGRIAVKISEDERRALHYGDEIGLRFAEKDTFIFNAKTGKRIRL